METILTILDSTGGTAGSLDLNASWLERRKGEQAVHDSVVAFLARNRAGTAATKTRGMVRGGGAKPYRQKGTGRARAGSNRSPIWRGGGTIFGPVPRSHAKRINRKVHILAMRRAFTERIDEGNVIVVDRIDIPEPKTKAMVRFLDAVGAGQDALVLVQDVANDVFLAARNLPGVVVMRQTAANPYWLLLFKKIVITRDALEAFGSRIAPAEKK